MTSRDQPIGYLALVRTNASFRRIWLGDIASLLGDWFATIALYTLVRELTGSPLAMGLVLITKLLPWALASPFAGLLVDRLDRRWLMIGSDVVRALVVLGFLLVEDAADLPLLYLLITLQVVLGAVFIPARSAVIPNITTARELLTANTLSAATWSTLLAVGAAMGGFAVAALGTDWVFLINSASYLVSAVFIYRAHVPARQRPQRPVTLKAAVGDILEGWRHMRRHPRIGRIALTKAAWALGGGAQVYMLTLLGEHLTPDEPGIGIGLLYAARGLGTGIGPVMARAWVPRQEHWPTLLGLGIIASGIAYGAVGWSSWSYFVLLLVMFGHMPSGANWTFSTVLLQQRTEDDFRGRVFATEWLLVTFADTVAILATSLLLEQGILSLRQGISMNAAILVATGIVWLLTIVPSERRSEASAP